MKKIVTLLFLIFFVININAQNTKREDIKELLVYTGMNNLSTKIVNNFIEVYKNTYDENMSEFMDTLNVFINENIEFLMDSVVNIYDKIYTHEDIKSIIAFYKTPVGKKIVESLPIVSELCMKAGQNWAIANSEKIENIIETVLSNNSKKEISFQDFYIHDEKFEYDNPEKVSCSKSNKAKIKGSSYFEYSLRYDSSNWETVNKELLNPVADLTFASKNNEAYAMIIAENNILSIQELKAAALYNLSLVAKNVKTESIGIRKVNGKEMLCMKISCNIQGIPYQYYNYYYSGEWGVLQFIVFSNKAVFDKNINIMEDILSGLYVK